MRGDKFESRSVAERKIEKPRVVRRKLVVTLRLFLFLMPFKYSAELYDERSQIYQFTSFAEEQSSKAVLLCRLAAGRYDRTAWLAPSAVTPPRTAVKDRFRTTLFLRKRSRTLYVHRRNNNRITFHRTQRATNAPQVPSLHSLFGLMESQYSRVSNCLIGVRWFTGRNCNTSCEEVTFVIFLI